MQYTYMIPEFYALSLEQQVQVLRMEAEKCEMKAQQRKLHGAAAVASESNEKVYKTYGLMSMLATR